VTVGVIAFVLALGAALSAGLTAIVRSYAVSRRILDHPNERSSHTRPTPRGGGVAFVASFLALAIALCWYGVVPYALIGALLTSAGLVTLVGWMDDRDHLPARWRFLGHTAASVFALWLFKGVPPVPLFGVLVDLGLVGLVLAAMYLVWMVNLCNFMDGIDGIASIEAITVSLGGAFTWWLATGTAQWFFPLVFAACVAGFLFWNYPPAKIFMGDAGSGFVGMVLGLFSLWAGQQAPQVFWCWFILLGCFMVDATTTLIRRVRRGEKFNEAHRSHAYQYAARKHGSHKQVSLAFGLINLLWLLPIAVVVALGRLDGASGVIVAYVPLVWLAFKYKAGDRAAQEH
jgi:Fuc2NAc and GlcNAc transferase